MEEAAKEFVMLEEQEREREKKERKARERLNNVDVSHFAYSTHTQCVFCRMWKMNLWMKHHTPTPSPAPPAMTARTLRGRC